jgi:hypothetical protein
MYQDNIKPNFATDWLWLACAPCRPAARRLQNMGWTPANQLWLSTRGGEVLINSKSGIAEEDYKSAQLNSRGFGILDVG